MPLRVRLIASGLIGAAIIAAIVVWVSADGGQAAEKAPPPPLEAVHLTRIQEVDLKTTALRSPTIRRLTERRRAYVTAVVPWVNEGTAQAAESLVGGDVKIDLRPPIRLNNEVLPVYITPAPNAPPHTPSLSRHVIYSAEHVAQLRALVDIHRSKVMEVAPSGRRLKVTRLKLLGPTPGLAYRERPGG